MPKPYLYESREPERFLFLKSLERQNQLYANLNVHLYMRGRAENRLNRCKIDLAQDERRALATMGVTYEIAHDPSLSVIRSNMLANSSYTIFGALAASSRRELNENLKEISEHNERIAELKNELRGIALTLEKMRSSFNGKDLSDFHLISRSLEILLNHFSAGRQMGADVRSCSNTSFELSSEHDFAFRLGFYAEILSGKDRMTLDEKMDNHPPLLEYPLELLEELKSPIFTMQQISAEALNEKIAALRSSDTVRCKR